MNSSGWKPFTIVSCHYRFEWYILQYIWLTEVSKVVSLVSHNTQLCWLIDLGPFLEANFDVLNLVLSENNISVRIILLELRKCHPCRMYANFDCSKHPNCRDISYLISWSSPCKLAWISSLVLWRFDHEK